MKQSLKIVFFGSGPVAAATLNDLLKTFEIEAIITKPRAEHHHGSVPVLEFAEQHKIKTFVPANKHELSELFRQESFKSPVGLVVDYGIIIEKSVIDYFQNGIVNSHFSLLPEWRGADPITFSILSGQAETGVSLMLINEKLDEGDLLAQEKLAIKPTTTTPQLTDKLIDLSNQMIIKYLPRYLSGGINPYSQPGQTPTYSRVLKKADGEMDINKSAIQLEREVRAYAGWPKSRVKLFDRYEVVVTKARVVKSPQDGALVIACADNSYLEIAELIAPSGRKMDGAAFLHGYKK